MKLFILLLTLLSTSVFASEIKVIELSQAQARWGIANIEQHFKVNEELGRAWVEVSVYESMGDGPMYSKEYQVKIPGLFYDVVSSTVNIDNEGQVKECAKIVSRGRGIFRRKVMVMDEGCRFNQEWKTTSYDDGFEIKKRKSLLISLLVD